VRFYVIRTDLGEVLFSPLFTRGLCLFVSSSRKWQFGLANHRLQPLGHLSVEHSEARLRPTLKFILISRPTSFSPKIKNGCSSEHHAVI
jgi:hypothetical protein